MPKGQRIEDDTIVWSDEERLAYGACRSLLQDGDKIGARLAFKERYEREVLMARSEGISVRWTVSAGYDIEHRLVTLARAVEEGRITTDAALNFVPGERQSDFSRMLPPGQSRGLLEGRVEKLPNLPGLAGILAQLKMEDVVPEELKPSTRPPCAMPSASSPEELHERRERLNEQIEFLRRSRNDQEYRKLG
jgi:hypothetical protein